MAKKVLSLIAVLMAFYTLFGAILESTQHGTLVVEVLSIDKEGVTFRSKLGATLVKAEFVKYVLMDEKRTELIGTKGIYLSNDTIVHGTPEKITKDSGMIIHKFGNVILKLSDIVYFTYDNTTPAIESMMTNLSKVSFSKTVFSTDNALQTPVVTLVNGTSIQTESINIQQSGEKVTFKILSKGITYLLSPGYIVLIELPKRLTESNKFVIRLLDSSILVGNPIITEKNILVKTPFGDTVITSTSNVFGIYESSYFTQSLLNFNLSLLKPFISVAYEKETATLNITILADIMLVDGNSIEKMEIIVAK